MRFFFYVDLLVQHVIDGRQAKMFSNVVHSYEITRYIKITLEKGQELSGEM